MISDNHPIKPPPQLVQQWCHEDIHGISTSPRWFQIVCTKAARWGANQELDACCADVETGLGPNEAIWLRSVRRPWPPSLKEQALDALDQADEGLSESEWQQRSDIIRRALESLPD